MSANTRLDEDNGQRGIDTRGEEKARRPADLSLHQRRVYWEGNRMEINNTKNTSEARLQAHPMANGTKEIPNVKVTGWLDTRKHPLFHFL